MTHSACRQSEGQPDLCPKINEFSVKQQLALVLSLPLGLSPFSEEHGGSRRCCCGGQRIWNSPSPTVPLDAAHQGCLMLNRERCKECLTAKTWVEPNQSCSSVVQEQDFCMAGLGCLRKWQSWGWMSCDVSPSHTRACDTCEGCAATFPALRMQCKHSRSISASDCCCVGGFW